MKVLAVLALILGIIAAVFLTIQRQNFLNFASTPQVVLNIVPKTLYLEKDQSAVLRLIINTQDLGVTSSEVHLLYDPEVIAIDDIKPGSFLANVLDNKSGSGKITLLLSSELPKKGIGILADIKIRSLVKAPSQIAFSPLTKVTASNYASNPKIESYGVRIFDNPASVQTTIADNIPEGVVYTDPESFIRSLTEEPEKSDQTINKSIKPGLSLEYAQYLLSLPIKQIQRLNEALEERTGKIIK